MDPVIRDLRGLEGEVKNAGEFRGYVGVRVLKALGKSPPGPAPLLGLRTSRTRWVSNSVMRGFVMCISVHE